MSKPPNTERTGHGATSSCEPIVSSPQIPRLRGLVETENIIPLSIESVSDSSHRLPTQITLNDIFGLNCDVENSTNVMNSGSNSLRLCIDQLNIGRALNEALEIGERMSTRLPNVLELLYNPVLQSESNVDNIFRDARNSNRNPHNVSNKRRRMDNAKFNDQ